MAIRNTPVATGEQQNRRIVQISSSLKTDNYLSVDAMFVQYCRTIYSLVVNCLIPYNL